MVLHAVPVIVRDNLEQHRTWCRRPRELLQDRKRQDNSIANFQLTRPMWATGKYFNCTSRPRPEKRLPILNMSPKPRRETSAGVSSSGADEARDRVCHDVCRMPPEIQSAMCPNFMEKLAPSQQTPLTRDCFLPGSRRLA